MLLMVNKEGQAALADLISALSSMFVNLQFGPLLARIARRAGLIRKAVILNKLD